MDKNTTASDSRQKTTTVCERLLGVARSTTPFRPGRSSYREDAAVASKTSPNHVSLVSHPPKRDRYAQVSTQAVAPADHSPNKQSKRGAPFIIDTASMMESNKAKAQEEAAVLPIHGQENRVPSTKEYGQVVPHGADSTVNGMFSEYIDRVGRKIRTTTNLGVRKPSMRRDSFNDRVSDFIHRAKNRLHTAPSFIGAGKTASLRDSVNCR